MWAIAGRGKETAVDHARLMKAMTTIAIPASTEHWHVNNVTPTCQRTTRRLFGAAAGSPSNARRRTHRVMILSGQGACTGYVFTAPATFPARSSKLSSQSLRVWSKELLHTTPFQTTLYTKVSGTMRSLAGRCYYFSLKRSIGQHRWRLHTLRPRWQWIRLCHITYQYP